MSYPSSGEVRQSSHQLILCGSWPNRWSRPLPSGHILKGNPPGAQIESTLNSGAWLDFLTDQIFIIICLCHLKKPPSSLDFLVIPIALSSAYPPHGGMPEAIWIFALNLVKGFSICRNSCWACFLQSIPMDKLSSGPTSGLVHP